MDKKQQIKQYCQQFKTAGISASIDQLIAEAETNGGGFLDYTFSLLKAEANHRHQNEIRRQLLRQSDQNRQVAPPKRFKHLRSFL